MEKILVVEDDADIQEVLKNYLMAEGYEVRLAEDGVEGLAAFQSWGPDLVLLDVMLPKVDGFAVLELIRKEYSLTDTQLKFVANFLRLPENEKDVIFNFLESVFAENETVENRIEKELEMVPDDPAELVKNYPPVKPNGKEKIG